MAKNEVRIPVIIDDKGSMKQTAKGAHSVDRRTKGAAKASSNASKNFSKMSQGITGGLVPAYATLAASLFAVDAVYRALSSAADLRILVQGQEAFAAKTGIAMRSVTNAVMEATDAQISFKEASQATAIGMAAGINGEQMTRLAKAATAAAKVLGRSVPDAFDRMTRGVIKAEPEVLDELGIILRLDTATENYAIKMGIAANSLTVFEKSQAVLNEVLTQAEGKYGDVAESIQPNTWTQLGVALEKVKDSFAIFASKVLEPVATFLAGNAMAAVGAVLVFVSSIMKGLIPSYAEQAAKFAESQGIMQAEIAETEARIMSLKAKQSGITETGGMALGGAQKIAMGATKADGRTTLGKLQRGKVISARQANAELIRLEKNKITKIDGMTKKHFQQYKMHLKTLAAESKMTGKKMQNDFELLGVKVKVIGLRIKTGWQATMRGMQRITSLATRAMSLAMGAMGWISMIFMVGAALKSWFDSTKEVDEAQKLLDEKIKATTDSLNKLNAEQELIFKQLDKTKKAWRATGDAVQYFANALNSVGIGSYLDALAMQGDVLNKDFVDGIEKLSENMVAMGIGHKKLLDLSKEGIRDYLNMLGGEQVLLNMSKAAFDARANAEEKLRKIQKERVDKALKYQYKEEIDTLMEQLQAKIKIAKLSDAELSATDSTLVALQNILRIENQLTVLRQAQANAAWRAKNAYGAMSKDVKNIAKIDQLAAKARENTVKFLKAKSDAGDLTDKPADQARLKMQQIQTTIDNTLLEAEARILALSMEMSTQIVAAATTGMTSGLQKGLSDLIQGKGSFKDLLIGTGQAMAKAMADAMAKNLANRLTGFIMPEDPREKIARIAQETILIQQEALNKTATDLAANAAQLASDSSAVQKFDDQLNIVGAEFLQNLRDFFKEQGLMEGRSSRQGQLNAESRFNEADKRFGGSTGGLSTSALEKLAGTNGGELSQELLTDGPGISGPGKAIQVSEVDKKGFGDVFGSKLAGIFSGGQTGTSGMVGGIFSSVLSLIGFSKGGRVRGYSNGGKIPGTYTGRDTVPAMLSPGEYVLTPSQMAGISGNNTVVNVNMTDSGAQTTTTGDAQALGRVLSIAVNKEIMKQKRPGGHLYQGGPGGI